jgi:hypothetical protein
MTAAEEYTQMCIWTHQVLRSSKRTSSHRAAGYPAVCTLTLA